MLRAVGARVDHIQLQAGGAHVISRTASVRLPENRRRPQRYYPVQIGPLAQAWDPPANDGNDALIPIRVLMSALVLGFALHSICRIRTEKRGIEGAELPAPQETPDGAPLHCTVSIGVTSYGGVCTDTPQRLLKSVDEALYHAKAEDRNRVCG